MIRPAYKLLGILILTMAAVVLFTHRASAKDILEFIDIPVDVAPQATIEPVLACKNGVAFGFHAVDMLAMRDDGPHQWDISYALDESHLLIKEFPLWLGAAATPLVRNSVAFPYTGFYQLLWHDPAPVGPLATCISGAGSGFCKTTTDIQDCNINPGLVATFAQIGPRSTTGTITDTLLYEVRTYDPAVGTANGDGIAQVTMQVIDPATGTAVFAADVPTGLPLDGEIHYCAFSPDCQPWVFSAHGYTWPDGELVESGTYLLRAIVNTPDNQRQVVQTPVEIDTPPFIETIPVPAGDFLMGSDTGTDAEQPAHTVSLDEFWIMKDDVTNAQYAQCVRKGACTEPADTARAQDPAYAQHPVTGVSWQQANDFAAWVGGRLPTEAEWEKTCRGTDGRIYPWGNTEATHDLANYDNLVGDTTPVGAYPDGAGPYGALDMSGNVWEWTSSLIAKYPYRHDGREDPAGAGRRIVRGGSYYYTHYQLTCSTRSPMDPAVGNSQIGFRVAFDRPLGATGISFVSPADGATVPPDFDVVMAANGVTIEPAGEIHAGAGHFHILVDTDFVSPGELIPFDDQHLHFGKGQMTAALHLTPGVHTLRLQVANGAHLALDGDQYRAEITVTVAAPGN